MKIFNPLALFLLFASYIPASYSGVVINGTRVIYNSDLRETSLAVKNNDKDVGYLVQSWVESWDAREKPPFVLTPPLFKLEPAQENMVRIIFTGNEDRLPQDRESIFWVNIKSLASTPENMVDKNKLQIAVKNKLKLFYRPKSLATVDAKTAYEKITFSRSGNKLEVSNPTPYFITLHSLYVGDHKVEVQGGDSAVKMMLSPFGKNTYAIKSGSVGKIRWSAVNDYGSKTNERQQN